SAAADGIGFPNTAYMGAAFSSPGPNFVDVTWAAKGQGGCALGCIPQAYIGTALPAGGSPFASISTELSGKQWNQYEYYATVDTDGPIYVALGWAGAGPTEAVQAVAFDCVVVNIVPVLPRSAGAGR